jgi:hypothetical protein
MAMDWLQIAVLYGLTILVVRTLCSRATPSAAARLHAIRPRRRRQAGPAARPIEQVVKDLRRLAPRFHHPVRGTSRTKIEATRHAYDHVLGEAATALGIEHLLGVLEPGSELDLERTRVETRLWLAGLRVDEPA